MSLVAASCGDDVGMTWMMNASEAVGFSRSLGNGPATRSTPGSASIAAGRLCTIAAPEGSSISIARTNGPLKPGPKPSATRSYACRVVVASG